jgi:hypothetical protein
MYSTCPDCRATVYHEHPHVCGEATGAEAEVIQLRAEVERLKTTASMNEEEYEEQSEALAECRKKLDLALLKVEEYREVLAEWVGNRHYCYQSPEMAASGAAGCGHCIVCRSRGAQKPVIEKPRDRNRCYCGGGTEHCKMCGAEPCKCSEMEEKARAAVAVKQKDEPECTCSIDGTTFCKAQGTGYCRAENPSR